MPAVQARRRADDGCVLGGDQAGLEGLGGGVVPGVEVAGEVDLLGGARAGGGGDLRDPGIGAGEPGLLSGPGPVRGCDQLQACGPESACGSLQTSNRRGVVTSCQRKGRTGQDLVERLLERHQPGQDRVVAVGVQVVERVLVYGPPAVGARP